VNREFIESEIATALKAHDKPRLSILRLVKNEMDIQEKESRRPLADDEVVGLMKKVLRQTTETLEASIKAGTNAERTALLQQQVDILTSYLPEQLTGEALAAVVDQVLAESGITAKRDMGRAIGLVSAACGGACDKAEVARLVGERLS
jgi:hypothetical protein